MTGVSVPGSTNANRLNSPNRPRLTAGSTIDCHHAPRLPERALITEVTLFDRYAGERLPEGKVSLAIQVTLQPREATLTDAQIEAMTGKIIAAVAKATGATLRG